MARKRTGTLELRKNGWFARITVDVAGKSERRWFPLGTFDKERARRLMTKLLRELEAGRLVAAAKEAANKPETVESFSVTWLARRDAQGVSSVVDERRYLEHHVLPIVGAMPLQDVRPGSVRGVLDAAVAAGLRRGSVRHVRGVMNRLFRAAAEDELVAVNPVAIVRTPKIAEVKRDRMILADDEITAFLSHPDVDLELKVLSIVARVEGGMRTGDLTGWDWTQLDLVDFEHCTVPRRKTGKPQALEVPELLRPILRLWWEHHGSPSSGPVFPRRRGKLKGERRSTRGVSFAGRLRRALLKAGIIRHVCLQKPGADSEKGEPCCANFASDPLYNDTTTTQRVDFHSFRRAFNTALAEAGVTMQQAMHLAGHTDAKTHLVYVMKTKAMQRIPVAALPVLKPGAVRILPRPVDDSFGALSPTPVFSVGQEGLEPSANGLRERNSVTEEEELRADDALERLFGRGDDEA